MKAHTFGHLISVLVLCSLDLVACNAELQGRTQPPPSADDASADNRVDSDPEDGAPDLPTVDPDYLRTPLHRLNKTEMRNTLRDLFGDVVVRKLEYLDDVNIQGVDTYAESLSLQDTQMSDWLSESLVVADKINFRETFEACDQDTLRACAQARLSALGRRMYKRPLASEELQSLMGLYDERVALAPPEQREDITMTKATRTVIARMLNAPDFLYHVEVGDEQGALTPYEFV